MVYIPVSLREQVIKRAKGCCEYCQTPQDIVVEMVIDHIIPQSAEGVTDRDNLCLSCISCNSRKYDFQTGIDSESGEEVTLFNPREQVWSEHFSWNTENMQIIGLTATGRATIERLKMNREPVINARRRWLKTGWKPTG